MPNELGQLDVAVQSAQDVKPSWYAIQTRPRHEKKVDADLRALGFCTFLPMTEQIHRWSDRRQKVQVPLFPRYLFLRSVYEPNVHHTVISFPGVDGFVGVRGRALSIPDCEIANVQLVLTQKIPFEPYPFLKLGQRVRCRGGALEGLEGILVAKSKDYSVVVSIELLQRSLAVRIDGYNFEPVGESSLSPRFDSMPPPIQGGRAIDALPQI
jgi:transcription termination/antitermination protein NusG